MEKVEKIMLEQNILETDLVFIYSNFLIEAITSLEKQGLLLTDLIKNIENTQSKSQEVSCV